MFLDLALADGLRTAETLATRGIAIQATQPDSLAPFKTALASLSPDLRLSSVEAKERSARVRFQRRDGLVVELEDLSDAEQQAVLFAATFVQQGLHRSVVLIDTPELYIHTQDHVRFLETVLALGSYNQVIVASSSEPIIRHASRTQVLDLTAKRSLS